MLVQRLGSKRHAGSFLAGLVLLALPAAAAGAVLRVPEDHFTIQEALDAAKPGDRVEVAAGVYRQPLQIRSGITLSAPAGRDSTILLIPEGASETVRVDSLAKKVIVRGFHLKGNLYNQRGVLAQATPIEVLDCRFEGFNYAVRLEGCPDALVARNEFLNTSQASIFVRQSSPVIAGNSFRGATNYAIAIFGPDAKPVIGGARGRANSFVATKSGLDVGNASPNRIDARYNDWGQATTVEMNVRGYPADLTIIEDRHDDPDNGPVDYRHWVGQPFLASLLSEPARLALPGILTLAVIVGATVRTARRRRPA